MKKCILSFIMAIIAIIAQAQESVDYSYAVMPSEDNWNQSSLSGTVTFTFDQPVIAKRAVAMNGAGGTGDFQIIPLDTTEATREIVVPISDSCWGDPYWGAFYMVVMLSELTDEDGNEILVDGEPLMPSVSYLCANTFPARFLHAVPATKAFSAASAYENSVVALLYSQEISIKDAEVIVNIVYEDTPYPTKLTSSQITCEPDEFTGIWTILIPVRNPELPDDISYLDEDAFSSMSIHITNVKSVDDVDVVTPTIMFPQYSPLEFENAFFAPKRENSTTYVEFLNEDSLATVYNMQGMCVARSMSKCEIKNLPSGLYVINGSKVILK